MSDSADGGGDRVERLLQRVDEAIRSEDLPWKRSHHTVEVELWRSGRRQRIQLERAGDLYVFSSTVVGSAFVTKNDTRWRDLAYTVWRKNQLKDIVTFAFDPTHRLIGRIEQPASTLDRPELIAYVDTLARECDRFEYNLIGVDRS